MFTLVSLAGLVLAGCNGTSDSGAGCPSNEPITVPVTVNVPTELKFALTVPTGEDFTVALLDDVDAAQVSAGSTVRFKVTLTDDVHKKLGDVKADGILLNADEEGIYSFMMPNHDVALEVSAFDTGYDDIMVNPDVDTEIVPTGFTQLKKNLTASGALEEKYLSKATIADAIKGQDYTVTSGDGVSVTTISTNQNKVDNNRPERIAKTVVQSGIADGYFYSIQSAPELGTSSNTGKMTDTATTMKIVDDTTEKDYDLRYLAKKGLADKASSTLFTGTTSALSDTSIGLSNYVLNNVFTYNNYFEDDTDYDLKTAVAEDKKSYTTTIVWNHYTSYSKTLKVYTSVTTFDGLGFMTGEDFSAASYAEDAFTKSGDSYTLNDGAVATSIDSMKLVAERGLKNEIKGLKDIHDYVLEDYDIHLQYVKPGQKNTYVDAVDGTKVEMGGVLRFTVSTDENKAISPAIEKLPDDELFTYKSITDITAAKKGTGKITFDNGLGVMKEVDVEIIDALPTSVTLSLDKTSIYVGDKAKLTSSVLPAAADQNVTVSVVTAESTGNATVAKAEDGSFEITGTEEGKVVLEAVSDFDNSIKAKTELNIMSRPVKDNVLSNIAEKTVRFAGSMNWGTSTYTSYFALYINFNADGTGTQRAATGSSYSGWTLQSVKTFSWTLGDDFKFTFTNQGSGTTYIFNSMEAIANDAFDIDYQGAYNYTKLSGVGMIDRVADLSSLKTSDIPAI